MRHPGSSEGLASQRLAGAAEVYAHKLHRHRDSALAQQAAGEILIHCNERHLEFQTAVGAKPPPLVIHTCVSILSIDPTSPIRLCA